MAWASAFGNWAISMRKREPDVTENRLLGTLTSTDLALLAGHLEPVRLRRGTVLVHPHEPIESAWFLTSGLSSIVAPCPNTSGVEVGMTGRDGMIGISLLLDSDRSPHSASMQADGAGFRIDAPVLARTLAGSASIQRHLLRYVHAFCVQQGHTALSNAIHSVEQRLARWLLMAHDRQDGDGIAMTHEFMALALGVRRPSVTIALHSLEGIGLLKATRSLVLIRDRQGMETFAQTAYGTPEAEYNRLIGPSR